MLDLGVVDRLVGDDDLGLGRPAAGLGPVALRLHDVLAERRGGLGDDGRGQQDALPAGAGEAHLDALGSLPASAIAGLPRALVDRAPAR